VGVLRGLGVRGFNIIGVEIVWGWGWGHRELSGHQQPDQPGCRLNESRPQTKAEQSRPDECRAGRRPDECTAGRRPKLSSRSRPPPPPPAPEGLGQHPVVPLVAHRVKLAVEPA